MLNQQLAGALVTDKSLAFQGVCERYRLAYLGVTGYHNASAVSNNGLVAVAQYMETPAYLGLTGLPGYVTRQWEWWPDGPRTFEQLQNMPNAYAGPARDGVYCPYRLSETSQDWCSASDPVVHMPYQPSIPPGMYDSGLPTDAGISYYPYGYTRPYFTSPSTYSNRRLIHKRSDTNVIHISLR